VKKLLPILFGGLCSSFTILPHEIPIKDNIVSAPAPACTVSKWDEAVDIYNKIGLAASGLSVEAFSYAYKGYSYLLEQNRIDRSEYLTICDFSQSSRQKRLYVIDLANFNLLTNTWVAHGKNSGAEYATRFSNKPESLQSSLGFYITRNTYIGKHGLSLKMEGVDKGYNDRAMLRTIVLHGANYVDETRIRQGMYMGRSWGCPSVPQKESAKIISTIKNGTCLFIYHPGRDYLKGSKILNG
jgi:hypothetical protein